MYVHVYIYIYIYMVTSRGGLGTHSAQPPHPFMYIRVYIYIYICICMCEYTFADLCVAQKVCLNMSFRRKSKFPVASTIADFRGVVGLALFYWQLLRTSSGSTASTSPTSEQ